MISKRRKSRDRRIYADFAQTLLATARRLYARDPMGVDLDQSLYALDSDLCLALCFPGPGSGIARRLQESAPRSLPTRSWSSTFGSVTHSRVSAWPGNS